MKKTWKQQGLALALTAGLLLVPLSPALAAEDEGLSFDLDQIVVTATKTEKKLRDVPAAVEVITKEEMERRNIKTVDDALKSMSGIYVKRSKGLMDTTDKVVMRGFGNQNQVLILLDGQPLNDGYNGSVNWRSIPKDNVERIEVIKGAGSALYGSNAMGGVINIITKQKAKPETSLSFSTGSMGTQTKSFSHSGSTNKLSYFLSGSKMTSDGYVSQADGKKGKNGASNENYDAKLVYNIDERSKLNFRTYHNNNAYWYEESTDRGAGSIDGMSLGYQTKLGDGKDLKLSWGENTEKSWYTLGTGYTKSDPKKSSQGEIQFNWQVGTQDLLTLGYTQRNVKAVSKEYTLRDANDLSSVKLKTENSSKITEASGKSETKSFYLQNEHKFDEKLTGFIGGRYDQWKSFDGYSYYYQTTSSGVVDKNEAKYFPENKINNFSPKLGLVYKANEQLVFRTSIGKAFRTPEIYDLYKDWWGSASGTGANKQRKHYIPNPDLKPEKSTSYDFGIDYQISKDFFSSINFFQSDVSDMIASVDTPTGTIIDGAKIINTTKINTGKGKIKGFEIGLNKKISNDWNSFFNYTYTDAKITDNPTDRSIEGSRVQYVPKESWNLGFTHSSEKWEGSLIGNYVSDVFVGWGTTKNEKFYEGRFTVDTKISYKPSEDIKLTLSVENLFDKKYSFDTQVAPGRATYLELTKKF